MKYPSTKEDGRPKDEAADDDPTAWSARTPPSTEYDPDISSAVPWQDRTYIIRDCSTQHALTLVDGKVVLAPLGSNRGSVHWRCVEENGWLGFQNVASGKFLGHNNGGWLVCEAVHHKKFEKFCVRAAPRGGYILFLTHWDKLWRVGHRRDPEGMMKLAKVENGEAYGIFWEFAVVH